MRIKALLLALFILTGCSAFSNHTDIASVSAASLGKRITVEGRAVDSKIGALLIGTNCNVWIDGLSRWPEGYYSGGESGKKVRVSGILTEGHDLPVFIPQKGEPIVQGIPIPEGTDLQKARHRYILKDARWELLQK